MTAQASLLRSLRSDLRAWWRSHVPLSLRRVLKWTAVAYIVGVALVVPLIAWKAYSGLAGAHYYRQSSGEGLGFFWIFLALFFAWMLAMPALFTVWLCRPTRRRILRSGALGAGLLLLGSLAASSSAYFWVESHGGACIGPCGPGTGLPGWLPTPGTDPAPDLCAEHPGAWLDADGNVVSDASSAEIALICGAASSG